MDRNARSHHRQTLGGVQSRARRAQAVDYFNILTSPELLDITEAHLPEHRERLYPPTVTLGAINFEVQQPTSCKVLHKWEPTTRT